MNNIQKALDIGLRSFDSSCFLGLSIHYAVQDINADEMKIIANKLADLYLTPDQVSGFREVIHERYAVVIRNIFGDLSNDGLVLSDTHPEQKEEIRKNKSLVGNNWDKPFEFCDILNNEFESRDNLYGVMLLCEMLAHRYGDLTLVGHMHSSVMEQLYMKSHDLAKQIQCQKQMFSPWYWGAFYFMRLGKERKSIIWFKNCHMLANKHMLDPLYGEMFKLSLVTVKKLLPRKEWKKYKRFVEKFSNPIIRNLVNYNEQS